MKTYCLWAEDYADGIAIHRALKLLLNLPEYYGMNADALYDCLSECGQKVRLCIYGHGNENVERAILALTGAVEDLDGTVERME